MERINRFAERLKELRSDAGLSQRQLADNIEGISSGAISNWEVNAHTPSIDALILLSRYFNVSVGYLIGEEK